MGISVFGYFVIAIIAGAALSAFVSGFFALKKRSLFMEDIGTLFVAPVAFCLVGILREELHTGFALILWPIIIAAICAYAFSAKVAFADATMNKAHRNSRILFLVALAAAAVAALTVPPWYE